VTVAHAVARFFPSPAAVAADRSHAARLSVYLTDMLAPYSLTLTDGAPDPVRGQSYGEMATALIDALEPSDVELLVLATDIPDITPGRATAVYLSDVCPGTPMAFGISDQGRAAAFTALRLVRDYAASGTYRRSLLLILEQSYLPYDPGVPVLLPAVSAGVGVFFDADTSSIVDVRIVPDVDGSALTDGLDVALAELCPTTVVLGGPLAHLEVKADRVVLADAGQPMTGGWAALADVLTSSVQGASAESDIVVLADYDPSLRYLCVAAFRR
jgi:hypothetical protein